MNSSIAAASVNPAATRAARLAVNASGMRGDCPDLPDGGYAVDGITVYLCRRAQYTDQQLLECDMWGAVLIRE